MADQQQPTANVNGHTGRDALIGGLAGHHNGQGHTGRDALIGGMVGHEGKEHKEKNAEEGKVGLGQKVKNAL